MTGESLKNFIRIFIDFLKRLKKNKIIIITVIIPVVMFFIPVKFAVNINNIDKSKEFYILKFIYGTTTDSGWYIVDCWDNKLFNSHIILHLNGKIPSDYLSNSICNEYNNRYVVYGSLEKTTHVSAMGIEGDYYILNISSWDILSNINGGLHKKYLTIYDLSWFSWLSEKTETWRADNIY